MTRTQLYNFRDMTSGPTKGVNVTEITRFSCTIFPEELMEN